METEQELEAKNARAVRTIGLLIGVGLALWGSYQAIDGMFGTHSVCFPSGSCIDIDQTGNIWFGLVVAAAGAWLAWRCRRVSP